MRPLAIPFVVAPPTGARIRTRLRLCDRDERVLWAVGAELGGLAGQDLAVRCRLGAGNDQRAERKRALTPAASSRWAGAVTRTSNDQWDRARRNLLGSREGLRRACRRVRSRLAAPVGGRHGRVRGYASRAERFAKQGRLQRLEARLAQVEQRLATGRVSVCRGGRSLAKLRHVVDREDVPLTEAAWRGRWQAARLFLTADGEADKSWGNETIRIHPDQQWLELKLPAPLAHLANRPHGRYRLSCPVTFGYRREEWAAQAASGAIRYDLWWDPARGRWYADASWRHPARPVPSLQQLRRHPALAIDLNAEHLDGWVLDPSGNPLGGTHTIPLVLEGLPASTRDGRLRAAVAELVRLAKAADCRCIVIEDLDFADARQTGRETLGRGARGKRFRRSVAAIPTRRFRDLLAGMAANAGLWVVAVDPAWTSVWGARYWQDPLDQSTKTSVTVTRHHAAAVVIGRRGLGLGARRRPGVPQAHRRMGKGELPARPDDPALGCQGPGPPGGQWAAAPLRKTHRAERSQLGNQVAQHRSVSPVSPDRG
jgi:IS605 OrfB family transposase